MPSHSGPNTASESNIVFSYDTGDTSNSYRGQPTTNTMRQSNNVTGTQYGYNNEYDTCQLVKTWNASLKTPVGTGATLLTEQNSGNSPWYGLNWYDESEDGKRCLSAYIYPINSVTQLRFGMVGDSSNSVFFNLVTRAITYGAGISNTNAFIQDVPGYPGWLRVGANIEGRSGGWVAFLGTGLESYYTPSTPYQSFYVCGIQYERNIATHCTQFTPAETTRSSTQGLLPLIGNTSINLSSVSFDSNAQMTFDGTDDYLDLGSDITISPTNQGWTAEYVFNTDSASTLQHFNSAEADDFNANWLAILSSKMAVWNVSPGYWKYGSTVFQNNTWYHIAFVCDAGGTNMRFYVNGVAEGGDHVGNSWTSTYSALKTRYIGRYEYAGSYSRYFDGKIAIAKMYDQALTSAEVKQNYQQYKTRFNLS